MSKVFKETGVAGKLFEFVKERNDFHFDIGAGSRAFELDQARSLGWEYPAGCQIQGWDV